MTWITYGVKSYLAEATLHCKVTKKNKKIHMEVSVGITMLAVGIIFLCEKKEKCTPSGNKSKEGLVSGKFLRFHHMNIAIKFIKSGLQIKVILKSLSTNSKQPET